jgi:glycogen(starch) synthase
MKILVVCQEDPEYILGGMGRHLRELFRAMATRGDVEIDMLVNGPHDGPKQYLGFTKYHSDKLICWKPMNPNMTSIMSSDIQMARTLCKLLAEGKRWDLVHVHEWNALQIARMVRDALDIPMVGTMHLCISKLMQGADLPPDMRKKEIPNFGEADIYLMQQEGHLIVDSDELILCSKAYERIIREVFLTDRQINVILNGIRTDEWKPNHEAAEAARSKLALPDRPIALFVGRIADMKGIRPLLEALGKWDSGYCVVIAGEVNANTEEDKERWEVTQILRDTEHDHPDRLRWVGFQHDDILKGLYSAAEIGLMPSTHEPFGIVALEFLSMGVPLICTEVDGLRELVVSEDGTEEYAMIIEPNNPYQIHEAMKILRQNLRARDELRELGIKRAGEFDWNVAANSTVEVYRKAIDRWRHVKSFNRGSK